jgi:CheY-like chemotaxis protein
LRGISQSARRQAQLIEDLLDVGRITSGKLRLERALVDLGDVVRDALLGAQPTAEAKGIRVVLDAEASIGKVYADGARLQQVMTNLLSNALKFTPAQGAVHVRLQRVGGSVELVVSDTGIGIPAEFLPWVFEPFRQADGSTTRVHSGLGLGLSIVRTLVEAHDGTVTVHSAGKGRGATFTVRLPVAICDTSLDAANPGGTIEPRRFTPASLSLQGLSVLVVDDDDETREVVAAHLQGSHAAVLTAASAARAFELLQSEKVDVLLADIGMPDEDGYGLIRRIRALSSARAASIPAAALTAFARDEDRERALQAGFQLHVPKPVDASALLAAVETLSRMRVGVSGPAFGPAQ